MIDNLVLHKQCNKRILFYNLNFQRRIMAKRSKKLPKLSNPFSTPWVKNLPKGVLGDSEVEGRNVFEAMIRPVGVNHFFK